MNDPNDKSLGEKTGVNSMLGLSPSTRDFITEAAVGDLFEIQSSRLALQQADPELGSFARRMIEDHTKTSDELKSLIGNAKEKAPPPSMLDDKHQKMLDGLREKSGAEFTRRYVKDQVAAHKEAVSLFERYADNGDNQPLRAWAGRTLPTLQHHLKMAQDMEQQRS